MCKKTCINRVTSCNTIVILTKWLRSKPLLYALWCIAANESSWLVKHGDTSMWKERLMRMVTMVTSCDCLWVCAAITIVTFSSGPVCDDDDDVKQLAGPPLSLLLWVSHRLQWGSSSPVVSRLSSAFFCASDIDVTSVFGRQPVLYVRVLWFSKSMYSLAVIFVVIFVVISLIR